MAEHSRSTLAVIMQRRALDNRWQSEAWEPVGVLTHYEGEPQPRVIVEQENVTQWLYPGMELLLRVADADGYYLNVSTGEPRVFVLWRMSEAGLAEPHYLTASYSEASSWMDAGEQVDAVPMPADLHLWVGTFVEDHYRPEPKKKIRPQSFKHPRDRARH
ncbi:MAG TPA: DUF3305 domain-containing protein [Burkholderiales bacterium]